MALERGDVATLHRELAWLSKREGFVPRRLTGAPILDEVLRGAPEDSFERMRHRFVSAIYTLPDDQSELLLDVFALSDDTADIPHLMQRRKVHGAKVGREVDTIRTREEAALKQLHSRLVSGRYAQAPLVLDVPEMHSGIIYEETSTHIIVKDRRWHATYEHYRFATMGEEYDWVNVVRSYPGIVTPHPRGRFEAKSTPVEGAGWNDRFHYLSPDRSKLEPMPAASRFDLRFRLTPDPRGAEPAAIKLATRAFHERSLLGTITVEFQGQRPASTWRISQASPYARREKPAPGEVVCLNHEGVVKATIRDAHGGLFDGFGWAW